MVSILGVSQLSLRRFEWPQVPQRDLNADTLTPVSMLLFTTMRALQRPSVDMPSNNSFQVVRAHDLQILINVY